MRFTSPFFIGVFLPVTLAGFYLTGRLAGRGWALRWLVAANFAFYGWWDPRFVPLLLATMLANHVLGEVVLAWAEAGRGGAARALLALGVAADLALLGWFKYRGFLADVAAGLAGTEAPRIVAVLPLAISFFTFQQIMFLVDGYRRARPRLGLLPFMATVGFFPHLIAGPLVRPAEIVPQFASPGLLAPRAGMFAAGLTLFLLGLAKKLVLADSFAPFADAGFDAAAAGARLSFIEAWYAVLAFGLQIYFDFSGYSDMAIGLAGLFNIRFPQNFDSPYQARNIRDFWRRWHITLSQFLRDYLYIPLGGNRHGEARRAGNLLATMLLGGLWHGAAWNFVLWGGLHGIYLIVHERFARWAPRAPRRLAPLAALLARAATLLAVLVAWVPFRAGSLAATASVLRGMAGLGGIELPQLVLGLIPPLRLIARPVPVLRHLGDARTLSLPEATAILALGWAIVLALPNLHRLSERQRLWAVGGSFALTVQALLFAPGAVPFLYFRF